MQNQKPKPYVKGTAINTAYLNLKRPSSINTASKLANQDPGQKIAAPAVPVPEYKKQAGINVPVHIGKPDPGRLISASGDYNPENSFRSQSLSQSQHLKKFQGITNNVIITTKVARVLNTQPVSVIVPAGSGFHDSYQKGAGTHDPVTKLNLFANSDSDEEPSFNKCEKEESEDEAKLDNDYEADKEEKAASEDETMQMSIQNKEQENKLIQSTDAGEPPKSPEAGTFIDKKNMPPIVEETTEKKAPGKHPNRKPFSGPQLTKAPAKMLVSILLSELGVLRDNNQSASQPQTALNTQQVFKKK